MKKIIYLILGVLLFIPFLVKADMGAPAIRGGYKATPKSPEGATIYKWLGEEKYENTGKKVEYGTVIFVSGEDDYSEEEYAMLDSDSNDDEDALYVKIKDFVLVEENYKIDLKKMSENCDAIILEKQEIRKGPAKAYGGTGKFLKEGTKVKVRFFENYEAEFNNGEEYDYPGDIPWVYVEYDGVKGFISNYEGKVATNPRYTTLVATEEASIYLYIDQSVESAKIKENTKLNATIYDLDTWSADDGGMPYYIEYANIKGFVDYHLREKSGTLTFKPIKNIKVYENLNFDVDNPPKTVANIKANTSFNSEYYLITEETAEIYYEKGNVKGWVYMTSDEYNSEDINPDNPKYLNIYKLLNITEKEIEKGYLTKVQADKEKTNENNIEDVPVEVLPGVDAKPIDDTSNVQKATKKVPMLVYYCLGVAVIVSLTAVVTVILANKKKKKVTTEEPKEEVKEEPTEEEKEKVE